LIPILVTGGAGYIGSHTCKALRQEGFQPIALDNLSRGFAHSVKWGPMVEGDIRNMDHLIKVLKEHQIQAVIHFAAFAYIKESVENPPIYFENNVTGTALLLEAMKEAGVKNIVFSSSCATYGESHSPQIGESHPQHPINPYGLSKLMGEKMLSQFKEQWGFEVCGLRYFNAAGADPDGEVGENHDPEPHLIPTLIRKTQAGAPLTINGNQYPTPDGTCVRDFIHVTDLANAHVLALKKLLQGGLKESFYNLGVGQGYSLLEVAETVAQVLKKEINIEFHPPRSGDPASLVCDASLFSKEMYWKPQYPDLSQMVQTAARWILA
jgi:UDP-arabinose 4-epimerase